MAVKITYFVHGTTTDNENDKATGWNQGELSELGIKQSNGLANIIDGKRFDAIFCSDLKRAVDSAKLNFPGMDVIKDRRLRECNYGKFNGKPDDFKKNMNDFVNKPFPGGESYKDVEIRVRSFLYFLKDKYPGKHIAIVAHQAPQLALEVLLKGKTWKRAIDEDWRKKKVWKPGWDYTLE